MAEPKRYQRGDVVVHPRRPEWGEGVVDKATTITHEGSKAQRLVVKFSKHGRVTINTAIANLTPREGLNNHRQEGNSPNPSEDETIMSRTQTTPSFSKTSTGQGWLGSLAQESNNENELWQLPEALTDPFTSLSKRLQATMDSYAYNCDPKSLLDWASAQTGLDDPMSKYTRHELELGFERFSVERERHLKNLIRQLKSKGEADSIKEVRRWLKLPAAVSALDKAMNQL